jgi:hypothetical protein
MMPICKSYANDAKMRISSICIFARLALFRIFASYYNFSKTQSFRLDGDVLDYAKQHKTDNH